MLEPTHKKQGELWTVEAGEYDEHFVLATFDRRPQAVKYRDDYNNKPGVFDSSRAYLGTIRHNPTI